ncbi:MAG: ABC transporter permease [Chloroflexi bacterium]|jgi:ABC-2 type transport system permease protein|nr:ABC transporter permease [Chloroflexota bacterium]MBT7081088.1 ABC transporter permease [Chloroflexota bacterium]MBT7289475.1 ABC transporter permease [Chloroflexota bacterium]
MTGLRAIYIIWYRDILRFWHDRMRMLGSITFPLLFLVIFGSGLSSSMQFTQLSMDEFDIVVAGGLSLPGDSVFIKMPIDYLDFMFPGIISMSVLTGALMGGASLVWDREFGFLKEVLVAPVNRVYVATGKVLGAATIALIPGLIIMIFAPILGISFSIATVFKLLPLMFLLAVSLSSLGILLATRIRSMEAFQMIMQLMMMPMIFLSGVFFPLQGLPSWLNFLTKINPASYGVAPIREVVLGKEISDPLGIKLFGHTMTMWENIAVLAIFGAMMITLAMWSFSHQE